MQAAGKSSRMSPVAAAPLYQSAAEGSAHAPFTPVRAGETEERREELMETTRVAQCEA